MPVRTFILLCTALTLHSCIGDDIIFDTVDPEVRILDHPDTLAVGDTYLFEARYLNEIGREEDLPLRWSSLDPDILSISGDGLATGLAPGSTRIIAEADVPDLGTVADTVRMAVGTSTSMGTSGEKGGSLRTTSSYVLEGDFSLTAQTAGITLSLAANYRASSALPGLYVYLSNNPNSVADAHEIGEVEVFNGAHQYAVGGVGLEEYAYVLYYCKPFNVKVGDGQIE